MCSAYLPKSSEVTHIDSVSQNTQHVIDLIKRPEQRIHLKSPPSSTVRLEDKTRHAAVTVRFLRETAPSVQGRMSCWVNQPLSHLCHPFHPCPLPPPRQGVHEETLPWGVQGGFPRNTRWLFVIKHPFVFLLKNKHSSGFLPRTR